MFFQKRREFFGVASIFIFSISGVFYYLSKDAYNLSAGALMGLFIFLFINGVSGHLKLFFSLKKAAANLAGLSFTLFLTHYTVLTYTKEIFKFEGMLCLMVGVSIYFFVAFILAFFMEYKLQVFKKFIANFIL